MMKKPFSLLITAFMVLPSTTHRIRAKERKQFMQKAERHSAM